MKTTIDLPEALVREIKCRAKHEGRTVKDVVADLLAAGLSPAVETTPPSDLVASKNLPLIKVRPVKPKDIQKMTAQDWCDWIKDVDCQLDVERYEKALGHQHVDRADG